MKLVFLTNYYNHHQKPLADAFYSMLGDDYCFIETETITEERLKMGWGNEEKPAYVIQYNAQKSADVNRVSSLVDSADVVIIGNAPHSMVQKRLRRGGLTFIYTERLYKKGVPWIKLPLYCIRHFKNYNRFKNCYVLCASAYTPIDFSRTFSFIGKTYKWGYFPKVKEYSDVDELIANKQSKSLLWVARFIEWKHPEHAVEIAKRLKADGYNFTLNMIGNGVLEEDIAQMIKSENLEDCVKMLGSMKPEQVRGYMENSEIFLFTSDRNEGWGAVLNESMNSACAVVANSAIGSVPFLLKNGENGYMYKDGDIDMLYDRVKHLLDNADDRKKMAKNAYLTMIEEWNAGNAAKKLFNISTIMLNNKYAFPYIEGICSKAGILKEDWLK